jgi:hypothetical protein
LLYGTIFGAIPCPWKEIVCGIVTALSVNVTVPSVLLLLTGVNVRVTGQTAPAARLWQLRVTTTVGSEELIEEIFSGAFPQFVTWMVRVDGVLALTSPKLTPKVSRHTAGAGVDISITVTKLWIGWESGLTAGGSCGSKLP